MDANHFTRWLVGSAGLLAIVSGCASAQHDDALRLSEELGRARAELAWERAHAAEAEARSTLLESRVDRLEKAEKVTGATPPVDQRFLDRLDRMLQVAEKLAEQRASDALTGVPSTTAAPVPAKALRPVSATEPEADYGASDLASATRDPELLLLAKKLLARAGGAGGISADEERALRLLLRSERRLDTDNPWPNALY